METLSIELTKEQREILIAFLNRVQLTGAEVPAFLEVANALNKPFEKKEEK
jgi:hypothetical protein